MPSETSPFELPLVAILRGVVPDRVIAVATALYDAGVRIIEIPLNSPDPYSSIAALASTDHADWLIGAGTVLHVGEVRRTHEAGGRLIVSPNCDPEVIEAALRLNMEVMPGIATATEAFSAIQAGAKRLKLFPAVSYGPKHLQALSAVLPAGIEIYPVGGIGASDISDWLAAGATGFGFGSELYRSSYNLADIAQRAKHLVTTLQRARHPLEQQTGLG